ncbi:hypothetical protein CCACVL1_30916 [Corchorus capsularis]|uniref:Uncharacterized protein n=1 Tax=Corchorus capsularis TaxID=210143 RepID=A0A1R3FUQ7_COCAP|nr:hypothetical protein CCACVL1_30916 [Corchorus capsularis]
MPQTSSNPAFNEMESLSPICISRRPMSFRYTALRVTLLFYTVGISKLKTPTSDTQHRISIQATPPELPNFPLGAPLSLPSSKLLSEFLPVKIPSQQVKIVTKEMNWARRHGTLVMGMQGVDEINQRCFEARHLITGADLRKHKAVEEKNHSKANHEVIAWN